LVHNNKAWTGLTKEQFAELLDELPSFRGTRNAELCLVLLLAKLRTGLSDERLATQFNVARSTAKDMCRARNVLITDFVRLHLGFQHVDRNTIFQHTSAVAHTLFCHDEERVIVVLDGTYVYIQKSFNYGFQRSTYSLHKNRPLMKPFMIVTTTGYIIDIFVPYLAFLNDAQIAEDFFMHDESVRDFFAEGDVLLVDRGFRDYMSMLQARSYNVQMLDFIPRRRNQLDDLAANHASLVTKCRFVVEVVNERLKQCFRYFDKVFQNKSIPHLMDDFKIAGALYNRFHPPIESDQNNGEQIAELILQRLNQRNKLKTLV